MSAARRISLLAGLAWLAIAAPVLAQAPVEAGAPRSVEFTADRVDYDNERDIVTASGNVVMVSESDRLTADRVVWERGPDRVIASGNVRVQSTTGDVISGDAVELTGNLRDGVVRNLLLELSDGSRLVAFKATRSGNVTQLEGAAYTACRVTDDEGCPRNPSWQLDAERVTYDEGRNEVTFRNVQPRLFGIALPVIPSLSRLLGPDGKEGFLIAQGGFSPTNGVRLSVPYYIPLGRNRDVTVTGHAFTKAWPMLQVDYRVLLEKGAYRVTGYATYGRRLDNTNPNVTVQREHPRGYLDASGTFQLDPDWQVRGSVRAVSDRTFLRRYDIRYDDRLRSTIAAQRRRPDSLFEVSAWATQTMRLFEEQGQMPIAMPRIDYRHVLRGVMGGNASLRANALALTRTSGQDTQRLLAEGRWDRRYLLPVGQELTLTALARADLYHTRNSLASPTVIYRGRDGVQGRGIVAAAADLRWPLVGNLLGGQQRLTPRVQLVASPATPNLRLPNEDSRAVDLEDSNLFALNRFPGFDRWEDGPRLTYGVEWTFDRPGLAIESSFGQSLRLNSRPVILPSGTGVSNRASDFVGRTSVRLRRHISVTHRFRLDKDNLAVRRNEVDATFGNDDSYVTVGYLRLNRNIDTAIEDLRDREEVRLGGRYRISRFWSVFGSATVDLTDRQEDPTSLADGFQPIRHRLGVVYSDDCLDLGLTWRRDYDEVGDARRGSSFIVRLAFRGFGR